MNSKNEILSALSPKLLQDEAVNFIDDLLEDAKMRGFPTLLNLEKNLFNRFNFPSKTTWKILNFLKKYQAIEDYTDETEQMRELLKGFDKEWSASLSGLDYKKLEDVKNILTGSARKQSSGLLEGSNPKLEKRNDLNFDIIFEDIEIDTTNLVFYVNQKKMDITGKGKDKTRKGLATLWCMAEKQKKGQGFVSREGLGKAIFSKLKEAGLLEKARRPKYFQAYATDSISYARRILREHNSLFKIHKDSLCLSVSKIVKG